jgi:predicted lipoprotein with Yx(FWY)xxD motif
MEEMMQKSSTTMLAVLALTAGMAIAQADEDYGPLKVQKTSMGNVLADPKGMTLYTFDKDTPGKSACTGECATYWPPVGASASDKPVGDLTVIKRDDGTMQWADHGKPLYTYVKDKAPGDVMGDKVNGVWHAVTP